MIKVFFSAFVLVAAIALTGCNKKEEEAEAPAPQQEETGDASTMSDSDASTMDDSDASTMSDSDTAATDSSASAAADSGEPKCPLCVIYEVATEGQPDDQTEFFSCADRPPEPPSLSWFEENCTVQQGDNQYFRSFAVEVMLPAN